MDQKASTVCLNDREAGISAIKLEVEKLYSEGEERDICSRHYIPNNKYGYCPECEAEPDLRILQCKKCNICYAEHISWDNDGFCDKCTAENLKSIVCKAM